MVRKKTDADRAYNARRRAKRAMQRALKEGKTKVAEYLKERISRSYADAATHRHTQESRKVLSSLERMVGQRKDPELRERRNQVFLSQLRRASRGEANVATSVSHRTGFAAAMEVNVFFMATRDVWANVRGGERDPLGTYAREMGFESYQAAWEYVMSQQEEALSRIDEMFPAGGMTVTRSRSIENVMPVTDVIYAEGYMQVAALVNVMR